MTDPAVRLAALRLLADQLDRMMARFAPGTPEYYALHSAHEAYRRAERVVGLVSPTRRATYDQLDGQERT